jgi:bisphosphoglycerate-dependent phosphoglycerate mutase
MTNVQSSSSNTYTLVLVRHGESQWNQENRFTGWQDVDLSEKAFLRLKGAVWPLKMQDLNLIVLTLQS